MSDGAESVAIPKQLLDSIQSETDPKRAVNRLTHHIARAAWLAPAPARDGAIVTVQPRVRRSTKRRARTSDAMLDALYSEATLDDMQRMARVAINGAIQGDAKARDWLTSTLIGDYATRQRAQQQETASAAVVQLWSLVQDQASSVPEVARRAVANTAADPVAKTGA